MSDRPVSVALATFNGASYLREQLASIAGQSRLPDELVACDDRSADDTVAILNEFASQAPFPVHVSVNPERLGYARNFRRASGLCSGDMIAFCDQDDWWAPEKLDRLCREFENPRVMLAYHNARIVDSSGAGYRTLYCGETEAAKLAATPFMPWHHSYGMTQMLRAELRRFDHFWDLSLNEVADSVDVMSHDQWYFFLALVCGEVRFCEDILVDYRQHGANSVGANPGGRRIRSRLLARLEHYGRQDSRGAEAASARAAVLRSMSESDSALAGRARDLASRYEILAQRLQRRCATYSEPGRGSRLASLAYSIARGDYRGWPWGFVAGSIIRDLVSGVILGRATDPEQA